MTFCIQTLINEEVSCGRRGLTLSGEYEIASELVCPPEFTIESRYNDLTISAAPTMPPGTMLNMSGAPGFRLKGVHVKGNRRAPGIADNAGVFAALVYDADRVEIEGCKFTDLPGSAVLVRDGKKMKFRNNIVDNVYLAGFSLKTSSPGLVSSAEIEGNEISRYGQHAIIVSHGRRCKVAKNKITSVRSQLNMTFNGSVYASSLSGPWWDNSLEGRFIITQVGGAIYERLVMAVLSSTQVQMQLPLGPISVAPVGIGNGDVISICASDTDVLENEVDSGASLGISIYSDGVCSTDRNTVALNRISGVGSAGISVQNMSASRYVRDLLIAENTILECAQIGLANDPKFNVGIAVQNDTTFGVSVIGNSITDYSGKMLWGLTFNAAIPASLRYDAGNIIRGAAYSPIKYDA